MNKHPRTHRALACALAFGTLSLGSALAAVSASATDDPHAALAGEYTSLSGAMLGLYAKSSGLALSDYLTKSQILLAPVPVAAPSADSTDSTGTATPAGDPTPVPDMPSGTATPAVDPSAPPALVAGAMPTLPALGPSSLFAGTSANMTPLNASSIAALNASLGSAGMTLDTRSMAGINALAASVTAKSSTLDAQVTLAGAKWVTALGAMQAPALRTPGTPTSAASAIPRGSLVFGLFANKALTNLVSSSPNLIKSVQATGVGTPALTSAWNATMLKTFNASSGDLTKFLPDACTGGMLAVMASGSPAAANKFSGSCAPSCITGGLYLNDQASSLFTGTKTTLGNPFAQVWDASTLIQLNDWQKKQMLAQNPNLGPSVMSSLKTGGSPACSTAGTATKATLGTVLPGVFSSLSTKR